MASVNKCILVGNITRDAEIKQVGQTSLAKFGVATSEKYRDRNGEVKEDVEFHNVELWGSEKVQAFLNKGQLVYVEGQIKTNRYTDRNGTERTDKFIKCFSVTLLGSSKTKEQSAPAQESAEEDNGGDDLPF